MAHSHAVHLPLGALLSACTMCVSSQENTLDFFLRTNTVISGHEIDYIRERDFVERYLNFCKAEVLPNMATARPQ